MADGEIKTTRMVSYTWLHLEKKSSFRSFRLKWKDSIDSDGYSFETQIVRWMHKTKCYHRYLRTEIAALANIGICHSGVLPHPTIKLSEIARVPQFPLEQ